jgi:hypothetical protein
LGIAIDRDGHAQRGSRCGRHGGQPARRAQQHSNTATQQHSNTADLGLTLSEAKPLLARVRQAIVAAQAGDLAARRPECPSCSGRCHVNGRRCHLLATPFGQVTEQLPRFRCVGCGHIERSVTWPSHCRSTPELDRLRVHLSALMPFRVAADVPRHLLPADIGTSSGTLRAHTLESGPRLRNNPSGTARPKMPSAASSGSTRSCMSSKVSAVIEPEAWHPENRGMRFTRSTNTAVARAPGWSTMPLDTAPACASGLR